MNLKAKMKVNTFNPELVDFNVVSNGDSNYDSVPSTTVESLLLPPEEFYFMYSQLNDTQKQFFSFIIAHIVKCKTASKIKEKEP